MNNADINFYFDPLCPFAWMTSKWVRQVAAQRDYTVDWRFISLRMLNADVDYDSHFPAGYEAGHTAGLRLLRVAARTRAEHGRQAVGPLYEAIGTQAFDSAAAPALGPEERGSREFVELLLKRAGLPAALADALDDANWDGELRAETDEALALTGKDVGTPIIHFGPPDGAAFFGPVISRLPSDQDAIRLWDHVVGLASFPGFAELKRSLRERPQLHSFGVNPGETGIQEDWHGGSRRLKKLRPETPAASGRNSGPGPPKRPPRCPGTDATRRGGNLKVKEVRIAEDERFVICLNPEAAERDAAIRARMIAQLEEVIRDSDQLSAGQRAELRGVIATRPGLNRYLRVTPGRLLRIDAATAEAEGASDSGVRPGVPRDCGGLGARVEVNPPLARSVGSVQVQGCGDGGQIEFRHDARCPAGAGLVRCRAGRGR
jgi:hypothetical protein